MTAEPATFVAEIDRDARRARIARSLDTTGVDFVEVLSNHVGTPGHLPGAPPQRTLLVHLVNLLTAAPGTPPTGNPFTWEKVRPAITGGVREDPRVNPVRVAWSHPALAVAGATGSPPDSSLAGTLTDDDRELVRRALPDDVDVLRSVLVVRTTTSGDWSPYTLHLLNPHDDGTPAGLDPALTQGTFTFTVDCPNPFDCCTPRDVVSVDGSSPIVDYLARDYDALRTRLLDRVATLVPDWTDRNAADPAVMLVELFAALGDRLAYWQDAVATEAFLGTARRRTSLRRHARLLDYAVHEGSSARTWLTLTTQSAFVLDRGSPVTDLPGDPRRTAIAAHDDGAVVMETQLPAAIDPTRNALELYSWWDTDHVLPVGATSAFLVHPDGEDPHLVAGDVLVLVDRPPLPAGDPVDAGALQLGDPALRFPVRLVAEPVVHHDPLSLGTTVLEIRWHHDDALPRPLRVSSKGVGSKVAVRAVALANVVLADHGATVLREPVEDHLADSRRDFLPRLDRTGVAFAAPVAEPGPHDSAKTLLEVDPRSARAQVWVDDGQRSWSAVPDLVGSGPLSPELVVEPESDGVVRLRFGDGVNGRSPLDRGGIHASYRVGGGRAGNVGAGRLGTWLRRPDGSPAVPETTTVTVWNPLPGSGGTDPEPMSRVRALAPTAYRRQLRAVTTEDYARTAEEVSGVQRAVARRRWTGSWVAEQVLVDPQTSRADDPELPVSVSDLLEVRRTAGVDVEVRRPVYVPLLVSITGCVKVGYLRPDVERGIVQALSAGARADGRLEFFHPDRFTFGQGLYLSDLVATVMGVPGVSWVEVGSFGRLADPVPVSEENRRLGRIVVGATEVLRCDSDPSNPENGRVEIVLEGG